MARTWITSDLSPKAAVTLLATYALLAVLLIARSHVIRTEASRTRGLKKVIKDQED